MQKHLVSISIFKKKTTLKKEWRRQRRKIEINERKRKAMVNGRVCYEYLWCCRCNWWWNLNPLLVHCMFTGPYLAYLMFGCGEIYVIPTTGQLNERCQRKHSLASPTLTRTLIHSETTECKHYINIENEIASNIHKHTHPWKWTETKCRDYKDVQVIIENSQCGYLCFMFALTILALPSGPCMVCIMCAGCCP